VFLVFACVSTSGTFEIHEISPTATNSGASLAERPRQKHGHCRSIESQHRL